MLRHHDRRDAADAAQHENHADDDGHREPRRCPPGRPGCGSLFSHFAPPRCLESQGSVLGGVRGCADRPAAPRDDRLGTPAGTRRRMPPGGPRWPVGKGSGSVPAVVTTSRRGTAIADARGAIALTCRRRSTSSVRSAASTSSRCRGTRSAGARRLRSRGRRQGARRDGPRLGRAPDAG
jgi:hypothetical protein